MGKTYVDGRGVRVTEDADGRHEELKPKPSGPEGLSLQAQERSDKTQAKPAAERSDRRGASAQTSAEFGRAIDKVRDEMAKSKSEQIQLLGEGLTALLQMHPEWEAAVLAKGKTLAGALEAVRKNATGGCSDPIRTTKSLCAYYGIKCENPHALALEVTVAMMGGEALSQSPADSGRETTSSVSAGALPPSPEVEGKPAADPFDLDGLLGDL